MLNHFVNQQGISNVLIALGAVTNLNNNAFHKNKENMNVIV